MIYLDYHATTPVDPRVLEAMLPFFSEHFGNASSRNHPFGWQAGKAVEHSREQVSQAMAAQKRQAATWLVARKAMLTICGAPSVGGIDPDCIRGSKEGHRPGVSDDEEFEPNLVRHCGHRCAGSGCRTRDP